MSSNVVSLHLLLYLVLNVTLTDKRRARQEFHLDISRSDHVHGLQPLFVQQTSAAKQALETKFIGIRKEDMRGFTAMLYNYSSALDIYVVLQAGSFHNPLIMH